MPGPNNIFVPDVLAEYQHDSNGIHNYSHMNSSIPEHQFTQTCMYQATGNNSISNTTDFDLNSYCTQGANNGYRYINTSAIKTLDVDDYFTSISTDEFEPIFKKAKIDTNNHSLNTTYNNVISEPNDIDTSNIDFDIASFNINFDDEMSVKTHMNSFLQVSFLKELNQLISQIIAYDRHIKKDAYDYNARITEILNTINDQHNPNQYLPKNISLSFASTILEEKDDFIRTQMLHNINHIDMLTVEQKNLLKKMDTSFFPKTLKPDICKLIDTQMLMYSSKLEFGYDQIQTIKLPQRWIDTSMSYFPVFVPRYINKNINSNNSSLFTIAKLIKMGQLKVRYITFRDIRTRNCMDYIEYLITCTDKIGNINEPTIFVCIPDTLLNSKMEIDAIFEKHHIKFFEYESFYDYVDFLFGCYKFIVIDNCYFGSKLNAFGRHNIPGKLVNHKKYCKTALKKLDVYEKFKYMQSSIQKNFLARPKSIFESLINNQIQLLCNNDDEKIRLFKKKIKKANSQEKLKSSQNSKKLSTQLNDKFNIIKDKINEQFSKEKDKTYSAEKLIEASEFFNKHCFPDYFYENIVNRIEINIKNDLKKFAPEYSFRDNQHTAFVLLPSRYYIDPSFSDARKFSTQYLLQNAEIKKYCFVKFYKSMKHRNDIEGKIFIALTEDIDINDGQTEDKVILFVPRGFDENNKPLYDPNQLSINGWFYRTCEKKDTGYPLYEFSLVHELDKIVKDADRDRTKLEYIHIAPDVKDLGIEKYLIEAYTLFYSRMKSRVSRVQKIS